MKKSAKEWFAHLPEPIRSQAVANWEEGTSVTRDQVVESVGGALIQGFIWESAPESNGDITYWAKIYIRAKAGEFDQPEPNLHGWISVADRLPTADDGGTDFLVLVELSLGYEYQIAEWFDAEDGETPLSFNINDTWSGQNQIEREVLFWQPLPKLPEVKGGENA
jgi:hypothetical protein